LLSDINYDAAGTFLVQRHYVALYGLRRNRLAVNVVKRTSKKPLLVFTPKEITELEIGVGGRRLSPPEGVYEVTISLNN
jgi:hypothetical protein